ncbi:hypothetical protein Peur_042796 [Populus x canadensis]
MAILLEMVARAARTSTISVSVRCNIGSKEMTCTVYKRYWCRGLKWWRQQC